MGYLGLDATEQVKQDNMFQRIFWPSDHAGETDALGRQGFWVCWIVAAVSSIALLLQHNWLFALLLLAFYGLAGVGVREHSQVAATLVALTYCMETFFGITQGHVPGFFGFVAMALLIANIRGTWIAEKWSREGGPDAMPERRNANVQEWFVDQMPRIVWPKLRIPFYAVSALYIGMTVLGIAFVLTGLSHRTTLHPQPVHQETVPVSPAP